MGLRAKAVYWIRQFPFIYPRKIVASCQDWIVKKGREKGVYFSQRGPWCKEIYSVDFLHNPTPQTLAEKNYKAFFVNQNYQTPKAELFYLQNSYVFGKDGLILSARNEIFQEFTHNFNITPFKKFIRKHPFYTFTTSAKKIAGTAAVLLSPESHNYYHWLNDVLPRIRLYEPVFDQIDHFCVSAGVPDKFIEILIDFGIPAERVLRTNDKEKLHFHHLYVSSLPGSEGRSPQWAVDYIREKLVKATDPKPSKKIYFKRGEGIERKILNEPTIISLLQSKGFEIVDPGALTIHEQISLMQQAKVVVGAHGAALSNLIFCPGGTSVIEIFSPDYFRTDCYYTLSAVLGFNYWYITGEKANEGEWGDIIVDPDLLEKTVAQLS